MRRSRRSCSVRCVAAPRLPEAASAAVEVFEHCLPKKFEAGRASCPPVTKYARLDSNQRAGFQDSKSAKPLQSVSERAPIAGNSVAPDGRSIPEKEPTTPLCNGRGNTPAANHLRVVLARPVSIRARRRADSCAPVSIRARRCRFVLLWRPAACRRGWEEATVPSN